MRNLAIALFALWLATAYLLMFAWADNRQKAQTIIHQQRRLDGSEAIVSQVLEMWNRRGPGPSPARR